jgi:hypothetical protein
LLKANHGKHWREQIMKLSTTLAIGCTAALATTALANTPVDFSLDGPGENMIVHEINVAGNLTHMDVDVYFTDGGQITWAGDLLIGIVDPNGNAMEYGGFNVTLGYPVAGDFPADWDVINTGQYTLNGIDLSAMGLSGAGTWTIQFVDGYTLGGVDDNWTGTLTLGGLTQDGEPVGACCTGKACSIYTVDECYAIGGDYLGDWSNCDNWACGGAPIGACCFGTDCTEMSIVDCNDQGGSFAGEGVTCDSGACDAPPGDYCDNAVSIGVGSTSFDTSTAVDSGFGDPDESQCEGTYLDWDGSPDRWFVWTATGDGNMSVHTCDAASYDTSLVLYEGDDCNSLVQIACNGDSSILGDCQAYYSHIADVYVTQGNTYYVRIGGWQAASGTGTVTLEFGGGGTPMGACCIDENCSIQTSGDCSTFGGEYHGDGTNCGNVDCGTSEPLGACCIDEDCTLSSASDCSLFGGDYQGDGSACADVDCSGGGPGDDTMVSATVGSGLVSGEPGSFTIDLFVIVGEGARLDAVAGTGADIKMLACSGDFYQNSYGGPTSRDVNPNFYPIEPDLEWDSRVTIGAIDSSGNPFPENVLQEIGIDWDEFENGGDMVTDNGTWFVLPVDAQGEAEMIVADDCSTQYAVRIARLTTLDMSDVITFEGIVQGRDANGDLYNYVASIEAGYTPYNDCNDNGTNDSCDIANGSSADDNGNGIPDECENTCPGDADGDGDSDVDDVLIVIANFGGGAGQGDVDGNGVVDVDDLLQVISWFGGC